MQDKFMFFKNFADAIRQSLPPEKQAEAYKAICEFALYDEKPDDPALAAMCLLIAPSLLKKDGRAKNGGNHNPSGNNQHGKEVNSGQSLVNSGQSLVNSGQSLVNSGQSLVNSGQSWSNPFETETDTETGRKKQEEKDIPYGISKKKEAKSGCRFENSEFFADVAPDEFVREAERTNPNVDPFDQYQRFKDYWTSKSGKDATKLDWVATWRNWLRNSYSGGNRTGAAKQKSAAELFADMTNW